jgi:hypothetical protein
MQQSYENMSVRAVYEDGEITFAEPVDLDGCWHVEVRFIHREDENVPYESSPHRPELGAVPDRLEELHRRMEQNKSSREY